MEVTANHEVQVKVSDEDMKFVGGKLCIDFVNTVDAWTSAPALKPRKSHPRDYGDTADREKLVDYYALVRWGRLAGELSAADADSLVKCSTNHAADAAAALTRALRLRRALYRIFKSLLERWEPECADLEVLHRELAIARRHEQLIYSDGAFLWRWEASRDSFDRMLWPVVRSAADLLTSSDLSRLRQCRGDDCGWVFLDTSRNRSRQWCDMTDCGNLNKVRRFRMRH